MTIWVELLCLFFPLASLPAHGDHQMGSYRSCRRPARRRRIFPCETCASGISPRRSQRCTGPAGCHWCWSCWSGCRTTAWLWPGVPCRRAWPPSWCPHTSSWWSRLTRQTQTPRNWGWVQDKPATLALASWSRPDQRRWNEKATNPGFWYVATVFPLRAYVSNLHNLAAPEAPRLKILRIHRRL